MLNLSTNPHGKDSCIVALLREGVDGLRQRVALQHKGLMFEHLRIDIFNFLEGECLGRSYLALLHHFLDGVVLLDVKLGINFGIIDLVGVHGFFEGEFGMDGHVQEVELCDEAGCYTWRGRRFNR